MLTSGKFLVSFEVPGPLPGTTEGFCEEMNVVYRTEELNTYLRYPKQPWHKHSTYIRLKLREILKVNLTDNITTMNILYHIILSVGTILILMRISTKPTSIPT